MVRAAAKIAGQKCSPQADGAGVVNDRATKSYKKGGEREEAAALSDLLGHGRLHKLGWRRADRVRLVGAASGEQSRAQRHTEAHNDTESGSGHRGRGDRRADLALHKVNCARRQRRRREAPVRIGYRVVHTHPQHDNHHTQPNWYETTNYTVRYRAWCR